MNVRILSTVVPKDVTLYFKNRFFALITVLGVVAYTAIYFLMPRSVDETLEIGIVAPALPAQFVEEAQDEGLILQRMDDQETLMAAVVAGDPQVGIVLPSDLAAILARGEKVPAQIYLSAELPEELRDFFPLLVQEWVALMTGQSLDIEATQEIIGIDRAGEQVAPRDRMLPLLAVFILMMETLGLASLITSEVVGGTLQALLVTPLRVEGLFLGKGITGVGLAFVQAGFLMAVTGGLDQRPLLILTALLLGAMMVTGLAFLLASVSRDMMSVMAWGILVVLLLAIPSFNVLLPGLTSRWVEVMPSFYLVDAVHVLANLGGGWADVTTDMLALLAYAAGFVALGVLALRRRMR